MISALSTGFGLGFVIAAQIGPIALLCIRSVLRGKFQIGVAIGLGAAVVDMTYALLGLLGSAGILTALPGLRLGLGLVGTGVLLYLGIRTLWSAFRIRQGMESTDEVDSVGRALRTSMVATASNPLTIAYWAAVFTAASAAHVANTMSDAFGFLVGIGTGSLMSFSVLSLIVHFARRRIGPRSLRAVDVVSGLGLVWFGGLLGWQVAHRD